MKMETVTYRRLYDLGNYENEVIEATCAVNESEPELLLADLRQWVDQQHELELRRRGSAEKQDKAISDKNYKLICLDNDIASMKETWLKAMNFLERMGIELPALYEKNEVGDEDIPF